MTGPEFKELLDIRVSLGEISRHLGVIAKREVAVCLEGYEYGDALEKHIRIIVRPSAVAVAWWSKAWEARDLGVGRSKEMRSSVSITTVQGKEFHLTMVEHERDDAMRALGFMK